MKKERLKINEFYDSAWEANRLINKDDIIRFEKIYSRLPRCTNILDIGCLDGSLTKRFADKARIVVGVDVSMVALKRAREKGIRCVLQDAESGLCFGDEAFDAVIAGEVLEHILDSDYFLTEIKRILKKNGRLYLTTPNFSSLGRRILSVLGGNPFFEASFTFPPKSSGHIRFFNKQLLFDFLRYHGFRVTYYTSDVVVLNRAGMLQSERLAKLFPSLGRSIIIEAVPAT